MKPISDTFRSWLHEQLRPPTSVTPDGLRYLAIAAGDGAPTPYHFRWLLPKALGDNTSRWEAVSTGSVLAMLPAMRWLTGRWAPGLFVFGLHGVWNMARRHPVLVDPAAMLAAIVAAAATKHRRWGVAVAASLLAGCIKETAPVFAVLYAQHWLPLIGLVSPAVMAQVERGDDVTDDFSHDCLERPFESAWWVRRGKSTDWRLWLAPLGALVAGFKGDTRTVTTVAAAYGQTVAAVDTNRMIVWAWPVLAENTVDLFGDIWPVALVAHWFNPWKESP